MHRHFARFGVDVRHAAQEMLAVRHDPLDVDDRTVPGVAAHVSDKIAGTVKACVDAVGAVPALPFDVADQRTGPIVA